MSSRKDGTMNFADQLRQTSLGAYQAEALKIHMESLKKNSRYLC